MYIKQKFLIFFAVAVLIASTYMSVEAAPVYDVEPCPGFETVTGGYAETVFGRVSGQNVGYTGNSALYVKFKTTPSMIDINYFNFCSTSFDKGIFEKNSNAKTLYDISFYIRNTNLSDFCPRVSLGYKWNENMLWNGHGLCVGAPDRYGWRHVTGRTTADAQTCLWFNVQLDSAEFYIDDISVTKVGGNGVNMLVNGDIEWTDPVSVDSTEPSETAKNECSAWIIESYGGAMTEHYISVNEKDAYTGKKSLYIKHNGVGYVEIKNKGTKKEYLSSEAQYNVSFYIKGTQITNGAILMGSKQWKVNTADDSNLYYLHEIYPTLPEDKKKSDEGWRKYSLTLCGADTDFTIRLCDAFEGYIDDISVIEVMP